MRCPYCNANRYWHSDEDWDLCQEMLEEADGSA